LKAFAIEIQERLPKGPAVTPRLLINYLLGSEAAIRAVAAGRNCWPLGPLLVLLTAFPRNYDQTWIGEQPFLWIFGPLIFSMVSGVFLFATLHGLFLRWRRDPETPKQPFRRQLVSFMGLFWLTAPIAWLYALPVERFLDPLPATWANLALLGVVALWRVLLMARVIQVVQGAKFLTSLVWVLVPASFEVLVIAVLGALQHIGSMMGGMRNSPEEELLVQALNTISTAAFWGFPAFCLIGASLAQRSNHSLRPFPPTSPVRVPWAFLGLAAAFWLSISIPAQIQVRRNAIVEDLAAKTNRRAVLDYLAAHSPSDFAPSRPLPPKAFERSVYSELPPLFGALQADDPAWVQAHLMQRFREMLSHDPEPDLRRPDAKGWNLLLDGLVKIPDGRSWIAGHQELLAGWAKSISEMLPPEEAIALTKPAHGRKTYDSDEAELRTLLKRLATLGIHLSTVPTNTQPTGIP
jgi:hypothetical protein